MIRRAQNSRDFEAIHRLILELAEYEKAPNEVITSPQILENHCQGNQPLAFAWVAELPNNNLDAQNPLLEVNQSPEIIGAAVCYVRYSTWKGPVFYLEDLIVQESHRKNGYGKQLLDEIIEFARTTGFKRIVWQVLDWNTPAIEFYKKYPVSFDESWINVTLELE